MEEDKMVPTVGGEEAGYLFEFKDDGVFFTVYPSGDSGILFVSRRAIHIIKHSRSVIGTYHRHVFPVKISQAVGIAHHGHDQVAAGQGGGASAGLTRAWVEHSAQPGAERHAGWGVVGQGHADGHAA